MVTHVGDGAAGLGRPHGVLEDLVRPDGLDGRVDSLANRQLANTCDHVLLAVVDDFVGAEETSQFLSLGDGFDRDDQPGAAQPRTGRGHQAHGTLAENGNGAADWDVGVLGAHQACGNHVGAVHGRLIGHRGWDVGQVGVGRVDVEVFGEDAVFGVRELPAAERLAGLR